jgi:hypothetical protein
METAAIRPSVISPEISSLAQRESMPQHNIDLSWSRGANSTDLVQKRVTKTADSEIIIGDVDDPLVVPGSTTDKQVNVAIDVSQLKSLFMMSTTDLLVELNNGTGDANDVALLANEPLIWWQGCGWDCPLKVDVTTGLYLTKAGAGDATVQMRFLVDATP